METSIHTACPNCHTGALRKSRRRGRSEALLDLAGVRAYRCTSCYWRGYGRPRRDGSISFQSFSEADLARTLGRALQAALLVAAIGACLLLFSRFM